MIEEGTYVFEGHFISYEQYNGRVTIREVMHHAINEPHNSHTNFSEEKAVEHQKKHIALGYDKVS